MTAERSDSPGRFVAPPSSPGSAWRCSWAAAFHWTPATFILSATFGAPLVLLGGALFLAAVWRNMRDKGAL